MSQEPIKKNIVQDVLPPKKTIRNIELSRRIPMPVQKTTGEVFRRTSVSKITDDTVESFSIQKVSASEKPREKFARNINIRKPQKEEAPIVITSKNKPLAPVIPSYSYQYDIPKKKSKKFLYTSIFVLFLAVAFGVSALFKSAEIKVSPKTLSQSFNDKFTAKKDSTGNGLGFQVVTVSKEMDKTVTATFDQKISKKSSGIIIVYNTGTVSQKLILGARFQTPEGLIFKSTSVSTVPARSVKSGKNVAGSLELAVEANTAGSTYNISLKDFTLPGLKGDPKYTQIYARSKTEMSGGYIGTQKAVTSDTLSLADKEMEESLKTSLAKDITSQIPSNFVLYTDGLSYSFNPSVQISSATSTAVLRKKATANAIIFDKGSLARTIVAQVLPKSTNDVIKITNLDSFVFSYSTTTLSEINGSGILNFNLSGKANFVWVFDENKLKSDLLGLSKDKATSVMSKYKGIEKAWINIKPFWNRTIPIENQKVTLVNTLL